MDAIPLDTLCTWEDAVWNEQATLYVPGTSRAFATASHAWDGTVRVDGILGTDAWYQVRFRATIEGRGVRVVGDIAPSDDPIFRLLGGPAEAGALATLTPDAMVQVTGGDADGDVWVMPVDWALERWRAWSWPTAKVPCERIGLPVGTNPYDEGAMLEAAGFRPDLPSRAVLGKRALPVRGEPDGPAYGAIKRQSYERVVQVAEERDGWTHVVDVDWTGVVWDGWVPSDRLGTVDPLGGGGLGLLGGLAGRGEPYETITCDASLSLYARVGKDVLPVGEVAAGAAMQPLAVAGDHVAVAFPGGWLQAVDGGALLVDAAATAGCPRATVTPEPSPFDAALDDDVFERLDDAE